MITVFISYLLSFFEIWTKAQHSLVGWSMPRLAMQALRSVLAQF